MERVISKTILVLTLLVALFGLLAPATVLAQSPTPTKTITTTVVPVPLNPIPTANVTETKEPSGFLGGLKKVAQDLWNLATNKEKRGSSFLDLLAMMLGGGQDGLQGLAEKFVDSDWFFPKFGEDSVGEDLVRSLLSVFMKLWLLALPVYYLTRYLGCRETLVRFLLNWALLVTLLLSDRLMWSLASVLFRGIEENILAATAVDNLKAVVDAIAVAIQNHALLSLPVMASVSITGVILTVAMIRFTYTVIRMLVMRLLTPIRLIRDLGLGRPEGLWPWFSQCLATFIEVTVFWVLVKVFLSVLAKSVPEGLVWVFLPAFALALLFIPAGFTEGLFAQIAQRTIREARKEQEALVAERRHGTEGRSVVRPAIVSGIKEGVVASLDAFRDLTDPMAMAQAGPTSSPVGVTVQNTVATQGGQQTGGAAAQASLKSEALKQAVKMGLDAAKVEMVRRYLTEKGIEVGTETLTTGGTALAAGLASIPAPVAVVAAAAAAVLGLAAAEAWTVGKLLSSNVQEYRHIGQLTEAIVNAEARKQAMRREAAKYRRGEVAE